MTFACRSVRGVFAVLLLAFAAPAFGEDGSLEVSTPAAASESGAVEDGETAASGAKADDGEAEKERQKNAKIGMVFVAGIGFLGVFLIAFILIYGRRLRRQLKHKRTPTQARDELWYLKSKPERPEREDADA